MSTDGKVDAGQHLEASLPVSTYEPDWRMGGSRDGMTPRQQCPCALALQDGAAIGHEPRVTDFDEAERQDMGEKSLDEAFDVECHDLGAAGPVGLVQAVDEHIESVGAQVSETLAAAAEQRPTESIAPSGRPLPRSGLVHCTSPLGEPVGTVRAVAATLAPAPLVHVVLTMRSEGGATSDPR
jgi:hypothetical protein